jgi:hypothetical protein
MAPSSYALTTRRVQYHWSILRSLAGITLEEEAWIIHLQAGVTPQPPDKPRADF